VFTLHGAKPEAIATQLSEQATQAGVERIVVGLPKNMNGTDGTFTTECRAFAEILKEIFGENVFLCDERLTSVSASRILGKNAKKEKGKIDQVAAALILEGYLSSLAQTSGADHLVPAP
jgi:putative Holliday junction resolvase